MAVTGLGTVAGAPFGGHAINLAAITAAMTAGPMAGPDRSRRWVAAVSASCTYLVLALGCAALTALVAASPGDVMQAAAGLAPEPLASACSSTRGVRGPASYNVRTTWLGVTYVMEGVFVRSGAGRIVQLEVLSTERAAGYATALLGAWLEKME